MKLSSFARNARLLLLLLLLVPLSACVRDIHLRQGLTIDEEQVARLEPGFTRNQVRFILGDPPAENLFSPDLWLYPYLDGDLGEVRERSFIRLTFDGERLRDIAVEKVPAGAPTTPSQSSLLPIPPSS